MSKLTIKMLYLACFSLSSNCIFELYNEQGEQIYKGDYIDLAWNLYENVEVTRFTIDEENDRLSCVIKY